MAILTQNESSPMFYSGWYGTEPELDIDECVSFPLISGTKDSSVRIYDEIQAVYLVSGNGQGTLAYYGNQNITTLI